jgi:hypothetical protein
VGGVLTGDGKRALALAIAFGRVLRGMVSPQAVISTLVGAMTLYLVLWTLPEPPSKGVAAILTAAMMAWLGIDTGKGLFVGLVSACRRGNPNPRRADCSSSGSKRDGRSGGRQLVSPRAFEEAGAVETVVAG